MNRKEKDYSLFQTAWGIIGEIIECIHGVIVGIKDNMKTSKEEEKNQVWRDKRGRFSKKEDDADGKPEHF